MKIAVYGTLKKGGNLDSNMYHIGAQFIESARLNGFSMYNMGWYPAIINDPLGSITVEVYEIDENGLAHLDTVEGYPSLYQRKETELGLIYYMEDKSRIQDKKQIEDGNWKV